MSRLTCKLSFKYAIEIIKNLDIPPDIKTKIENALELALQDVLKNKQPNSTGRAEKTAAALPLDYSTGGLKNQGRIYQTKTYIDYCKEHAIDELENLRGHKNTSYGCDLGYMLTDEINVNGSATFSRQKAREYIREWWEEAAEVYEYQKDNYGQVLNNPFENPEAFHVCMIIEGVDKLCANCPTIDANWNEDMELTDDIIDSIISEIKAQTTIEF